jgi:hypothetical protein
MADEAMRSRGRAVLIGVAVLVLIAAGVGAFAGYAAHAFVTCNQGEVTESGSVCGDTSPALIQMIIAFLGLIPASFATWAAFTSRSRASIGLMVATVAWYAAWVLYIAAHSHS